MAESAVVDRLEKDSAGVSMMVSVSVLVSRPVSIGGLL